MSIQPSVTGLLGRLLRFPRPPQGCRHCFRGCFQVRCQCFWIAKSGVRDSGHPGTAAPSWHYEVLPRKILKIEERKFSEHGLATPLQRPGAGSQRTGYLL
jgi:hypothetical protein